MRILLEQLKTTTLEKIKGQLLHLDNMANTANQAVDPEEEAQRFAWMKSGSDIIFAILEGDPIGQHSIQAFLDQLDVEQLQHTQTLIKNTLEVRGKEDRIPLWECYTELSTSYHYLSQEDASNKLVELMKIDLENGLPKRSYSTTLKPIFVPKSEVPQYITGKEATT